MSEKKLLTFRKKWGQEKLSKLERRNWSKKDLKMAKKSQKPGSNEILLKKKKKKKILVVHITKIHYLMIGWENQNPRPQLTPGPPTSLDFCAFKPRKLTYYDSILPS